jgi:hypothetical protein
MNYHILREYISLLIKEQDSCNCAKKAESDDDKKQILSEPDESEERSKKRDEQSVVSSIAGVTTPLGTGPTYPSNRRKTKKKK